MMKATQLLLVVCYIVATALAGQTTAETPTYFGCTDANQGSSTVYSRDEIAEGYCISETDMAAGEKMHDDCPTGFEEVSYQQCYSALGAFQKLAEDNGVRFALPQITSGGELSRFANGDINARPLWAHGPYNPYCHISVGWNGKGTYVMSIDKKTVAASDNMRYLICQTFVPKPPTPSPTPAPTGNPTEAPCVPDFNEKEAIDSVFRMYKRNAGGDATQHIGSDGEGQTTPKLLAGLGLDNKKGRRTLKMLATRTVRALRKSQKWDQK